MVISNIVIYCIDSSNNIANKCHIFMIEYNVYDMRSMCDIVRFLTYRIHIHSFVICKYGIKNHITGWLKKHLRYSRIYKISLNDDVLNWIDL